MPADAPTESPADVARRVLALVWREGALRAAWDDLDPALTDRWARAWLAATGAPDDDPAARRAAADAPELAAAVVASLRGWGELANPGAHRLGEARVHAEDVVVVPVEPCHVGPVVPLLLRRTAGRWRLLAVGTTDVSATTDVPGTTDIPATTDVPGTTDVPAAG